MRRIDLGGKIKLSSFQKKIFALTVFLLKFSIAAIPIYIIMRFDIDFFLLQEIEAKQVSMILNSIGLKSEFQYCGIECSLEPNGLPSVLFDDRAMAISRACTGYRSFFALVGLMLAAPNVKKKKRLLGILWALPVIYIINILRLTTTAVFSRIIEFDIIHNFLWKQGLMVSILLVWYLWLKHF